MSYVSQAELAPIKTRINQITAYLSELVASFNTQLSSIKKNFNGLVDGCKSLETNVNTKTETLPTIEENIEASKTQLGNSDVAEAVANLQKMRTNLDSLINYLEHWIDAGNVNMKDIRASVLGQ